MFEAYREKESSSFKYDRTSNVINSQKGSPASLLERFKSCKQEVIKLLKVTHLLEHNLT